MVHGGTRTGNLVIKNEFLKGILFVVIKQKGCSLQNQKLRNNETVTYGVHNFAEVDKDTILCA